MKAKFPVSAAYENSGEEVHGRSENYHPSIWGGFFLSYDSSRTEIGPCEESEHQLLKEQVRKILIEAPCKSLQKLEFIDAVQRLGVSYHFETEIGASLKYVYDLYHECFQDDGSDIYAVALRFQLLRQQGHPITCDVFNKFKDTEGKFDEALLSNVRGILRLYEAAHFRVHGEDTLDEALTFTTTHLESMASNLGNFLAPQVIKALKSPIRLTLPRLEAREYISIYQEDEIHNDVLLKFAKLDFNIVQKMHQKELSDITRWWKDLDVPKNFPFARDRLVEGFYCAVGIHFEPKYCVSRRLVTKLTVITAIMDDIYDVYGTIDELELFTDAIQRWDISASQQLPPYMRHCYHLLLDFYTEIEEELAKFGKSHAINFAKEVMKKYIGAYLQEAKWSHDCYIPKFKEYMNVGIISVATIVYATISYAGMGDILTEEVLKWISNEPLIISASSEICRLMDDIGGHEVASAVECYMEEFSTSKKDALIELRKQVTNAWKDMNKECLDPVDVPLPFLMRFVHMTQLMHLLFTDGHDGFTHSKGKLETVIYQGLVNPVTI